MSEGNTVRVEIDQAGMTALFSANGVVGKWFAGEIKKVEELAKTLCPVDTGYLRSTIHSEIDGDVATVSADADYALFVEMGTIHMAAQPFLRPAIGAVGTEGISGGDGPVS